MATKDRIKEYIKKFDAMKRNGSQRDDWYNRITHYAVPNLYNVKYDTGVQKSNLPADVYDSEMVQASFEFGNLFYTYLTNPSSKWLGLTLQNPELLESPGVKDYLESLERKIYQVLSSSNFYSTIHQAYRSLTMGNCIIYRERDEDTLVRYSAEPLSQCYYEYNSKGRIDAMYRELKRTPLQLVEEFPKTVSKKVKDAADGEGSTSYITCFHIVRPRWHRDPTKRDTSNKKFESIYIDKDNSTILSESGYDKFPFFIGHFIKDPYSAYSYGPGHMCLYDTKSLNQLMLSTIRRAAKEADPVTNLPHDGYILPYLQDPGSVNYRTSDDPKDKAEYMMPPPASSAVRDVIEDMRSKIKKAFFVDLYRSIVDATKRMTTVEVQQRVADRAPMLGPAVGNLTTEFINYLIEDLVEILLETKQVEALPENIAGQGYSIEYLSPLAKSQKVSEFNSLQAFLQFLGGAMQFDPNVVDNIDWDKYVRVAGDATGIPQNIINEINQVQTKRKERLEALAAQQGKQEVMAAAGAAKDAAQADKALADAQKET